MAIAWPIASALSSRFVVKLGFQRLVRAGFFVVAVGAGALAFLVGHGANATQLRIAGAVFGVGMGVANTPLVIAVQTSVGFSQRGVATSSTLFFRNIGGTIAVGVMGVVLARALLAGATDPALVAQILGPERRGVPAAVLTAIAGDLAAGLGQVMWLVAGLAALSAALAWLFPHVSTKPT
jgi:hypothetical protein